MESYPTFKDVDIKDVYKDLNKLMYMLHHLDKDLFSKREVCDVCFSVQVTLNTLEKLMNRKKKVTGIGQ